MPRVSHELLGAGKHPHKRCLLEGRVSSPVEVRGRPSRRPQAKTRLPRHSSLNFRRGFEPRAAVIADELVPARDLVPSRNSPVRHQVERKDQVAGAWGTRKKRNDFYLFLMNIERIDGNAPRLALPMTDYPEKVVGAVEPIGGLRSFDVLEQMAAWFLGSV